MTAYPAQPSQAFADEHEDYEPAPEPSAEGGLGQFMQAAQATRSGGGLSRFMDAAARMPLPEMTTTSAPAPGDDAMDGVMRALGGMGASRTGGVRRPSLPEPTGVVGGGQDDSWVRDADPRGAGMTPGEAIGTEVGELGRSALRAPGALIRSAGGAMQAAGSVIGTAGRGLRKDRAGGAGYAGEAIAQVNRRAVGPAMEWAGRALTSAGGMLETAGTEGMAGKLAPDPYASEFAQAFPESMGKIGAIAVAGAATGGAAAMPLIATGMASEAAGTHYLAARDAYVGRGVDPEEASRLAGVEASGVGVGVALLQSIGVPAQAVMERPLVRRVVGAIGMAKSPAIVPETMLAAGQQAVIGQAQGAYTAAVAELAGSDPEALQHFIRQSPRQVAMDGLIGAVMHAGLTGPRGDYSATKAVLDLMNGRKGDLAAALLDVDDLTLNRAQQILETHPAAQEAGGQGVLELVNHEVEARGRETENIPEPPPESPTPPRPVANEATDERPPPAWMQRQADYVARQEQRRLDNASPYDRVHDRSGYWASRHRDGVEEALRNGETVPPEVLADYPGIESTERAQRPDGSEAGPAPEAIAQPETPQPLAEVEDVPVTPGVKPESETQGAERIVAAAVQDDAGNVYQGTDHAEAFDAYKASNPSGSIGNLTDTEGFVTSTGRYVSRSEATSIAIQAKQIHGDAETPQLTAEDLGLNNPKAEPAAPDLGRYPHAPGSSGAEEQRVLDEYLAKHDHRQGQVPAREPYLPTRDEDFAEIMNGTKMIQIDGPEGPETMTIFDAVERLESLDASAAGEQGGADEAAIVQGEIEAITSALKALNVGNSVSAIGPEIESVQEAIRTGERLGYRPEDIAAYLHRNYTSEGIKKRDANRKPKAPSSAPAREPWEMTRAEYIAEVERGRDFKQLGMNPTPLSTLRAAGDWESLRKQAARNHEAETTIAVAQAKNVHERVLADYPGLYRSGAKPKTAPQNKPATPNVAEEGEAPTAAQSAEQWLARVRFYSSGGRPSAELPDGRRLILAKGATAGNFREHSRDFLLSHRPASGGKAEPAAPKAHKFSTTQYNLRGRVRGDVLRIAKLIPEKDLDQDEGGRETAPHLTIKYGLHTDDPAAVQKAMKQWEHGAPEFNITGVSVFPAKEAGKADVVKLNVNSEALHHLHAHLADRLEHTDTHSTYTPHITLGYVKAGRGEAIAQDLRRSGAFRQLMMGTAANGAKITDLQFSNRAGQATKIKLPAGTKALPEYPDDSGGGDAARLEQTRAERGTGQAQVMPKAPEAGATLEAAKPTTLRMGDREIALADVPAAILEAHGIEVTKVIAGPGAIAMTVQDHRSGNTIRQQLRRDGYEVITRSLPREYPPNSSTSRPGGEQLIARLPQENRPALPEGADQPTVKEPDDEAQPTQPQAPAEPETPGEDVPGAADLAEPIGQYRALVRRFAAPGERAQALKDFDIEVKEPKSKWNAQPLPPAKVYASLIRRGRVNDPVFNTVPDGAAEAEYAKRVSAGEKPSAVLADIQKRADEMRRIRDKAELVYEEPYVGNASGEPGAPTHAIRVWKYPLDSASPEVKADYAKFWAKAMKDFAATTRLPVTSAIQGKAPTSAKAVMKPWGGPAPFKSTAELRQGLEDRTAEPLEGRSGNALHLLWVENKGARATATDGRSMFSVTREAGTFGGEGLQLGGKVVDLADHGGQYPHDAINEEWTKARAFPPLSATHTAINLVETLRVLRRVEPMTNAELSDGVAVYINKDGTIGAAAGGMGGQVEVNMREGGELLGAWNISRLMDALTFARQAGGEVEAIIRIKRPTETAGAMLYIKGEGYEVLVAGLSHTAEEVRKAIDPEYATDARSPSVTRALEAALEKTRKANDNRTPLEKMIDDNNVEDLVNLLDPTEAGSTKAFAAFKARTGVDLLAGMPSGSGMMAVKAKQHVEAKIRAWGAPSKPAVEFYEGDLVKARTQHGGDFEGEISKIIGGIYAIIPHGANHPVTAKPLMLVKGGHKRARAETEAKAGKSITDDEIRKAMIPPAPPGDGRPWQQHNSDLLQQIQAIERKRFKTNADEITLFRLRGELAADPSKWQAGDGVGYYAGVGTPKRRGSQINRGFQIVRVDQATKQALIRQVADTGLTSTGGNNDRIGDQWVEIADLVRDKKYNAPDRTAGPDDFGDSSAAAGGPGGGGVGAKAGAHSSRGNRIFAGTPGGAGGAVPGGGNTGQVQRIKMPELVRLARALGADPIVKRRMGRHMGLFQGGPLDRGIKIQAALFGDPYQAAAVLAHEIGHLFDFMDEGTLKRGNVLGRVLGLTPLVNNLGTLKVFLKNTFPLSRAKNKELRKELIALTWWWSPEPGGPAMADKRHKKYRESAAELYAEALSVWLNSPGQLQQRAPLFYAELVQWLDRKPEVLAAYNTIQDLLAGTPEELAERRRADIREDFATGVDILKARAQERANARQNVLEFVNQTLFDTAAPIIAREKKAARRGIPEAQARSAQSAMEELSLKDNQSRIDLGIIQREVQAPLLREGLTREDLGELIMMRRIAAGDRQAFANPRGHTAETAQEMLDSLEANLGPAKFAALQRIAGRFDDVVFAAAERAVAEGVYSEKTFKTTIEPNRGHYATFAVLDYLDDYIPHQIIEQVGTFKGITNPFDATLMKMVSLNRAVEINKAKRKALVEGIGTYFPGEVVEHKVRHKPGTRPNAPKAGIGKEMLPYQVDGKTRFLEVDRYVAKAFGGPEIGVMGRIGAMISKPVYGVFHPLYVTFSPSFAVANLARDFKRTYSNSPGATIGQVIRAYMNKGARGAAWARATRQYHPLIEQMIDERALDIPFTRYDPTEDAVGYDKLLADAGLSTSKDWIDRIGTWGAVFRPIEKVLRSAERFANFTEALPKVVGWNMQTAKGVTGPARAYHVRNYVGTPNTRRRGLATTLTNGIFMYSNVILQGMRADAEVGFGPKTAGGWWLRSMLVDLGPKLVMKAAAAGLFGAGLAALFGLIPDYDKAAYIVIPFGTTTGKDGQERAVYLRIPHGDSQRMIAATAWYMMQGKFAKAAGEVAGQLPFRVNPILDTIGKWADYAQGRNPYDEFRNRSVIEPSAFTAGGWAAAEDMARFTVSQFGVMGTLMMWAIGRPGDPRQQTTAQRVIGSIPGLERILRVSDRGLDEKAWEEVDLKDQESARFKLGLPQNARNATRERYRLQRLRAAAADKPGGKLPKHDEKRLNVLMGWYRDVYLPATRYMHEAQDRSNTPMSDKWRAWLERETDKRLK